MFTILLKLFFRKSVFNFLFLDNWIDEVNNFGKFAWIHLIILFFGIDNNHFIGNLDQSDVFRPFAKEIVVGNFCGMLLFEE